MKLFDIFNNKLIDTHRLTIELKNKQAKPLNFNPEIIQSYLSFINVTKLDDIDFNYGQLLEVFTRHQGSKKQYINSMVKGVTKVSGTFNLAVPYLPVTVQSQILSILSAGLNSMVCLINY